MESSNNLVLYSTSLPTYHSLGRRFLTLKMPCPDLKEHTSPIKGTPIFPLELLFVRQSEAFDRLSPLYMVRFNQANSPGSNSKALFVRSACLQKEQYGSFLFGAQGSRQKGTRHRLDVVTLSSRDAKAQKIVVSSATCTTWHAEPKESFLRLSETYGK
jgi:hypothetical protein